MLTGDQVLAARTRAGMTQQQLADKLGVTQRSVGNWERAERVPRGAEQPLRDVLKAHLDDAAPSGTALADISDARLLAEIARRFDRGREEGGSGGDTAANTRAGESPAKDGLAERRQDEMPEDELPWAAHPKKGRESEGRRLRRRLDEVGEESQDPGEGL